MRLNMDKCEIIQLKSKAKIWFRNGKHVPTVKNATYLGANIDPKGYRAELEGRLRKANTVFHKFKVFWRKHRVQ